jgi:hypothetical protein
MSIDQRPSGSDAKDPSKRELGMTLTIDQEFELERFSRAIDSSCDAEELRAVAKQLLRAWHLQKAAASWLISQQAAS